MPELPDITVYIEALDSRLRGEFLRQVRISAPFLLRTASPPVTAASGQRVREFRRVGKRIAMGLENDLWLVIHLMIAGRLHWKKAGVSLAGRRNLAAWDFDHGSLLLTEAGSQRRASLHVVSGESGLRQLDPGGIDVLSAHVQEFQAALTASNHTLKRSLTDPGILSGIGNAYSDEILHQAQLSPVKLTQNLTLAEVERLHAACRKVLTGWTNRLRSESGEEFPEKVTAFREGMAVHGRYGMPCPQCGEKIQRIRHANNETNYCPKCQTGGRLLADRALSRLLKQDWPRTLEEMEDRIALRQSEGIKAGTNETIPKALSRRFRGKMEP